MTEPTAASPFVWVERLFTALEAPLPPAEHRDIHVGDEMLLHGLERSQGDLDLASLEYWASGLQVARTLTAVADWRFGGWAKVPSFLDFGGGYGRVMRHLLAAGLRPDAAAVAEVLPEALSFQQEVLGVRGFASAATPAGLDLEARSFLYAGSLFTHLPGETFPLWLEALLQALAEDGVLVFSVHDPSLMPPELRFLIDADSGLAFHATSENLELDPEQYGSTWVTEGYVAGLLKQLAPGCSTRYLPRGLCNYQDLWIVARGGVGTVVDIDGGGQGALELARLEGRRLRLAGWALHRSPAHELIEVEAFVDGRSVGATHAFYARPDLLPNLGDVGLPAADEDEDRYRNSGWEIEIESLGDLRRGSSQLVLVLRSSGGNHVPLFAGSLESALYLATRENHHRKVDEVKLLETRIDAMRRSRFWRLRDRWFAVKRTLGLTDQP
ncbi:MAG: hypothetical protein AAF690_11920 [Acidobacteriota bacterium]